MSHRYLMKNIHRYFRYIRKIQVPIYPYLPIFQSLYSSALLSINMTLENFSPFNMAIYFTICVFSNVLKIRLDQPTHFWSDSPFWKVYLFLLIFNYIFIINFLKLFLILIKYKLYIFYVTDSTMIQPPI